MTTTGGANFIGQPQINVPMQNLNFISASIQDIKENSFSDALLQLFRTETICIKDQVDES